MATSPELIQAVGEALYGPRFETALAYALGVNRRTVYRWRAGTAQPRKSVWIDLRALLEERAGELAKLAGNLPMRSS